MSGVSPASVHSESPLDAAVDRAGLARDFAVVPGFSVGAWKRSSSFQRVKSSHGTFGTRALCLHVRHT